MVRTVTPEAAREDPAVAKRGESGESRLGFGFRGVLGAAAQHRPSGQRGLDVDSLGHVAFSLIFRTRQSRVNPTFMVICQ